MRLSKVNKQLLPMKLHYFFFNAGMAPFLIFGSTILKQMGYSSVTVGVIYSAMPLIGLISKPIISATADKFECRRGVFLWSVILSILTILAFCFVPDRSPSMALSCLHQTYVSYCGEQLNMDYVDEHFGNNSAVGGDEFYCKVLCENTPEFSEELCNRWKIEEYCSIVTSPRSLGNSANVYETHSPKKRAEKEMFEGKSSVVKNNVDHPIMRMVSADLPPIVSFTGTFHKHRVFTDENRCLYAKISVVNFSSGAHAVPYCKETPNVKCKVQCADSSFNEALSGQFWSDLWSMHYWVVFALFAINWVANAINTVCADTVTFSLLSENGTEHFGKTRMYGSLGWGLMCALSGWLADYATPVGELDKNYLPLYAISIIVLSCDVVVAAFVQVDQVKYSRQFLSDIGALFTEAKVLVFTGWCFFIGICSALIWQFLFWHLEDIVVYEDRDTIKTVQGLDGFVATVFGELPFFFISGWFLRKLGHTQCMCTVALAIGLRMLLYSLLSYPPWVLPIELLNGFTYGIFYTTMTSYASVLAPPGMETTAQGLFTSIFDGIGVSVGSMVGGLIFHRYKGAVMFRTFGIAAVVVFIVLELTATFCKAPAHRYTPAPTTAATTSNNDDKPMDGHYSIPDRNLDSDAMLEMQHLK